MSRILEAMDCLNLHPAHVREQRLKRREAIASMGAWVITPVMSRAIDQICARYDTNLAEVRSGKSRYRIAAARKSTVVYLCGREWTTEDIADFLHADTRLILDILAAEFAWIWGK